MREDEKQLLLTEQELLHRVMEAVDGPGPPDQAALATALTQDVSPRAAAPARAAVLAPRHRTPHLTVVPRQTCRS